MLAEFKETIKNARKLDTSVAPALQCKITKICGSDGSNNGLHDDAVSNFPYAVS